MRDGSTLAHTQWRIGITIAQIARRWRARLDQRIAEYGLTEARWLALLAISRGGEGMTQKDLAGRLLIEGPTLVRTLDWLGARAWSSAGKRRMTAAPRPCTSRPRPGR